MDPKVVCGEVHGEKVGSRLPNRVILGYHQRVQAFKVVMG